MLLAASSKMLRKTHLVVSNSDLCLNRGSYLPLMPRNQITLAEFRTKLERLKNELYWEEEQYGHEARGLAHKYLNKVFDILDEYRL